MDNTPHTLHVHRIKIHKYLINFIDLNTLCILLFLCILKIQYFRTVNKVFFKFLTLGKNSFSTWGVHHLLQAPNCCRVCGNLHLLHFLRVSSEFLSFNLHSVSAINCSASLLLPRPNLSTPHSNSGSMYYVSQHFQMECLFSQITVFIFVSFSPKHCCFFILHKADSQVQPYSFHLLSVQQSICDSQSLADSWGNCLPCLTPE